MVPPSEIPPAPSPDRSGLFAWLQRHRRALLLLVLVGLPSVLIFWTVGLRGMLYEMDAVTGSYHIEGFVGQELREGRLPVWDPHSMCGFPLLAGLQFAALSPLSWTVAVLGPGRFCTLTVLVSMVLAGSFSFGWLRRGLRLGDGGALVGAVVVLCSGYFLVRVYAGHLSQIATFPWMLAVLWRVERLLSAPTLRRVALLGGSYAMVVLAGYPQFLVFVLYLTAARLGLHAVGAGQDRRSRFAAVGGVACAGLLGMLLAAPQLLATMEILPQTQRASSDTYAFATSYSLAPENLLTLLAPTLFGDEIGVRYWGRAFQWEVCGFVGIGALVLAALGAGGSHAQRKLWIGVTLLALLLALGRFTPIFRAAFEILPGVRQFRAPGRYLSLWTVSVSALAAMGFDRWWKDGEGMRRTTFRLGAVCAALAGGVLLLVAVSGPTGGGAGDRWQRILSWEASDPESSCAQIRAGNPEFAEDSYRQAWRAGAWAGVTLIVLAGVLLTHARGRLPGRAAALIVGGGLLVELLAFGGRYLRRQEESELPWPTEFVAFVRSRPGWPFRIASPVNDWRDLQHVGRCQLAGLDHVSGYESMLLRRYAELVNVISGEAPDTSMVSAPLSSPHPVLDMLGVKLWLVPPHVLPPPGWLAVGQVDARKIVEAPAAFPRAFLVGTALTLPARDERLRWLANPNVDLSGTVVLEVPPPGQRPSGAPRGVVRSIETTPGRYEIRAESPQGEYLVLTESYYPGWRAWIDDAPAEILCANHLVQAIWLPPGSHRVRFEYRPRWLGTGFALCALGAAASIGLIGTTALRRRRQKNLPVARERREDPQGVP